MLSLARRRFIQTFRRRMSTTSASRRVNPTSSSTDSTTTVIDNPCWGSATECSLAHVIAKYLRAKSILLETSNYLVLNKPPDLRMDGDFPATVQKLLLAWYPPPSLQSDQDLLTTISSLQSIPKDLELRHCHQLDYATSGVLLFARSRKAAAAAQQAFCERQVDKVYLAVVHGILVIDKEWPVLPKERLLVLKEQETLYRQKRGKKRNDTFDGFMPPHSMLQKWSAHYLKQQQNANDEKAAKRLKSSDETIDLNDLMKQALHDQVLFSADELNELANSSWKQVKRNPKQRHVVERLSNIYNDIMRTKAELKEKKEHTALNLPKLFRIEGDDNAFYIFAPLAEVDNAFAMRVQPGTLQDDQRVFEGTPELDYKPSLTRCVVLETVVNKQNGVTLTKVRLEPKTGRRHQLRVHMLIAGTSILGDATYEREENKGMCPRMCLHAHSLSLQALGETQLRVEAPDPFDLEEISNVIDIPS